MGYNDGWRANANWKRGLDIYEGHNGFLEDVGELRMEDLEEMDPDFARAIVSLIEYAYEEGYQDAEEALRYE